MGLRRPRGKRLAGVCERASEKKEGEGAEQAGWRAGLAGAGLAGPAWEAKAQLGVAAAVALLLFLF